MGTYAEVHLKIRRGRKYGRNVMLQIICGTGVCVTEY
jgi:hypothetical protein